jgi:stress-induced morphogen
MAIEYNTLYSAIKNGFPEADIKLRDTVGDRNHYEVNIVSGVFNDLSKVEQHKLVHKVLKDYLGADLHALSIQTYTK